jgi:hypothetical protein
MHYLINRPHQIEARIYPSLPCQFGSSHILTLNDLLVANSFAIPVNSKFTGIFSGSGKYEAADLVAFINCNHPVMSPPAMKNQKAIVSIAIGDKYLVNWKRYCEPNWRGYANKNGFDLICFEQPLDHSERAGKRSPAWQKCLILSQDAVRDYERVVWVDSDIMFNDCAPDITAGVHRDKVGAIDDGGFREEFHQRVDKLWPTAIPNHTPREYYRNYGLPDDCDESVNTGVLVLSPFYHREILEHVYYAYEEKGGREWLMEQRPLSYELLKRDLVQFLDPRFNVMLSIEEIVHYPFLLPPPAPPDSKGLLARIERKVRKMLPVVSPLQTFRIAAVNTIYQSSYFMHFGGKIDDMALVNPGASSWWNVSNAVTTEITREESRGRTWTTKLARTQGRAPEPSPGFEWNLRSPSKNGPDN